MADREEPPILQQIPPTRFQMIEYISVRQWWTDGQKALLFTLALWGIFVVIVWLRMDVEAAFEVNNSLETWFSNIIAEPSRSGRNPRPAAKTPVPCRCACQGSELGPPSGPCGAPNERGQSAETIEFMGEVGESYVEALGLKDSGADVAPAMRFADITSVEEAWYWVEHGVVPAVWKPQSGRSTASIPGLLLRRNLVIGGIRVRQDRAQAAPNCDVDAALQKMYPPRCRSDEPLTTKYGPKESDFPRNSSTAKAAFSPVADLQGIYDAVMDVEMPMEDALDTVDTLRRFTWVDDLTRSFKLQAVLLNAEAGLYALVIVSFNFPDDGAVEKKIRVRSLIVLDASLSFMDFIPEICWMILIALLIRQELVQVCIMCFKRQCCEYFSDPWNAMDWVSIGLGVPVAFYWWVVALQTYAVTDDIVKLPRPPPDNLDLDVYHKDWAKVLDDVTDIFFLKQYHAFILFWYTVVLTLRFLKNFLTQQKLATIQLALSSAFVDCVHFFILYFSTFANFVLGGRILFGSDLDGWSSMTKSASSCLRMLMGHLEFEDMYEVAPVSATLWFWLFLLCMVFLLSNVLLAMIADHVAAARDMVGVTPSFWEDAYTGLKDLIWRLEWRWQQFGESEYMDCFWRSPYSETLEGLLERCEVDDEFMKGYRKSSLGVRLFRKQKENESLMGLKDGGNPGAVELDERALRALGSTPFCARHLLDKCAQFVASENTVTMSQVEQFRQLVKLLTLHKKKLSEHCQSIEEGVEGDKEDLWQHLKRLENSVRESLERLRGLRQVGVDTLAPPLPGQHKMMLEYNQEEERLARLEEHAAYQAEAQEMTFYGNQQGYHDNVLQGAAHALQDARGGFEDNDFPERPAGAYAIMDDDPSAS